MAPYKLLLCQGTASCRAFTQHADGRPMVDVTDQLRWSSDDEATFTVDGGQLTLNQGGVVPLRAQLGDLGAKLSLTIVTWASGIAQPLVEGTEHLPTLGESAQLTASLNFPDG